MNYGDLVFWLDLKCPAVSQVKGYDVGLAMHEKNL